MTTQELAVPSHPAPDVPMEEGDPTPRTVDWNNPRVAAILEAAAKCFSRKGFSATTLAEIGKELGLRKSIVHYYFASKAALIHEVQSYTYFRYLERVRDAVRTELGPGERSIKGIRALWEAAGDGNVGLNIEVWSASRNDEELKRRAAALQKEKRKLVAQSIADMLGADPTRIRESLCTLVLSVLNGLTVCEYVEGEGARAQESFDVFVSLLRAGLQNLEPPQQHQTAPPHHPSQPPHSQPPAHLTMQHPQQGFPPPPLQGMQAPPQGMHPAQGQGMQGAPQQGLQPPPQALHPSQAMQGIPVMQGVPQSQPATQHHNPQALHQTPPPPSQPPTTMVASQPGGPVHNSGLQGMHTPSAGSTPHSGLPHDGGFNPVGPPLPESRPGAESAALMNPSDAYSQEAYSLEGFAAPDSGVRSPNEGPGGPIAFGEQVPSASGELPTAMALETSPEEHDGRHPVSTDASAIFPPMGLPSQHS